jgi:hypothetical protein
LTTAVIKGSDTTIGTNCFFDCENLSSVTIEEGIQVIGSGSFEDCYSLESITLPNTIKLVRRRAFAGCIGLTSLVINEGVTAIGQEVFNGCKSLVNLTLPSTLEGFDGEINPFIGTPLTRSGLAVTSGEQISYENGALVIGAAKWKKVVAFLQDETEPDYDVTLPDGIDQIISFAFPFKARVRSITIQSATRLLESAADRTLRRVYITDIPERYGPRICYTVGSNPNSIWEETDADHEIYLPKGSAQRFEYEYDHNPNEWKYDEKIVFIIDRNSGDPPAAKESSSIDGAVSWVALGLGIAIIVALVLIIFFVILPLKRGKGGGNEPSAASSSSSRDVEGQSENN